MPSWAWTSVWSVSLVGSGALWHSTTRPAAGSAGHFRWMCTEADRTTALVTGTLGTLDRIGVLAQYSADEGEQWRWINALVRFPTCFW